MNKQTKINRKREAGFTLMELLVVVAIIGIVATIAVFSYLAGRRVANEGSAAATLRQVNSAETIYLNTSGGGTAYATISGAGSLCTNGFLSGGDQLCQGSTAQKAGYTFTGANITGVSPAQYVVWAAPTTMTGVGQTGTRRFCITEDGVIHADAGSLTAGTADAAGRTTCQGLGLYNP